MILYHGSNVDIQVIDLTKSRPNKDFGQGFYLTEDKQQALRIAEQKVLQGGGSPIVNSYEFDDVYLTDSTLHVKRFEGYTEEWAQFILANRNRETKEKLHDYDIVIGAIADDKQFLIDSITTELIVFIMDDYHCDMETAMDKVYNSDTYTKLVDTCTGLYYQSPRYVYDFLKEELKIEQ